MEESFSGSSWILGAKWNSETNRMQIYIGKEGEVYECEGVDSETWSMFKQAKSKGKYFNSYIKGKFDTGSI